MDSRGTIFIDDPHAFINGRPRIAVSISIVASGEPGKKGVGGGEREREGERDSKRGGGGERERAKTKQQQNKTNTKKMAEAHFGMIMFPLLSLTLLWQRIFCCICFC